MSRKLILAGVGLAIVIATSVALALNTQPRLTLPPSPQASQPKITWSTPGLGISLSAGQSASRDVTFTSDTALENITLAPVPELAPLLTLQPSFFAAVSPQQPQRVRVVFTISPLTPPGIHEGTIHLRQKTRTLPETLKVSVTVVWASFKDTNLGISFQYPDFGRASKVVSTQPTSSSGVLVRLDVQLSDDKQQQFFSVFGITVYRNSTGVTLQQWFAQNVDGGGILASAATFSPELLKNGFNALALVGPVPSQYLESNGPVEEVYAISPARDRVFAIVQSQDPQLSDLGYSQELVRDLLKAIVGTIQL